MVAAWIMAQNCSYFHRMTFPGWNDIITDKEENVLCQCGKLEILEDLWNLELQNILYKHILNICWKEKRPARQQGFEGEELKSILAWCVSAESKCLYCKTLVLGGLPAEHPNLKFLVYLTLLVSLWVGVSSNIHSEMEKPRAWRCGCFVHSSESLGINKETCEYELRPEISMASKLATEVRSHVEESLVYMDLRKGVHIHVLTEAPDTLEFPSSLV